ncbi:hypothetical protein K438DRAFT_1984064 [Mycena galopus ATCC 62051]|nr:hypothetical protein K438DRAFT_1984064 [Mycena galopus ATCC 62051]
MAYRPPSPISDNEEDCTCDLYDACPQPDPRATCPACRAWSEHMPVPHYDYDEIPARGPPPYFATEEETDPFSERILPTIPFALPFTLFILEAYFQGGWLHLLVPYTICMLVYFL